MIIDQIYHLMRNRYGSDPELVCLPNSKLVHSALFLFLKIHFAAVKNCLPNIHVATKYWLLRTTSMRSSNRIQCFEGEVHSRKRKCIPFFGTLHPFLLWSAVICADCLHCSIGEEGGWVMSFSFPFQFSLG